MSSSSRWPSGPLLRSVAPMTSRHGSKRDGRLRDVAPRILPLPLRHRIAAHDAPNSRRGAARGAGRVRRVDATARKEGAMTRTTVDGVEIRVGDFAWICEPGFAFVRRRRMDKTYLGMWWE